ncbi:50S ribosomal protein L4 [Reichenbachiella sp. MSK19-1]|uniref:50S ribosomal protein L4 n=1 Tax=Reichenbachiella sp. MSK19-1 TaxID=1897631 RepID=UPI000E6D3F8F|nr:50S ribosomal protein L4 [Reichenbachiella sp. MSK19-1]RJE70476.1 50S ribosomal protein L4 [Reichenbachiella sp. MSK19-1]
MKVSVLTKTGEDTGRKVDLSKDVFGIEPNDHAIYLDVKQFLANQRQGTHKSKERAEIAGSTRKIKKQKGTGTARAGSIKSPVFRGGGRVFGPRPRNYSIDLNKKLKVLARKSALSYKATEKSISILEDFSFDAPKTKDYVTLLNTLSFTNKKTLLVLKEDDKNVLLSSKNLKKAQVTTAEQINTYDLLNADNLILLEGSIEKIQNLLTK